MPIKAQERTEKSMGKLKGYMVKKAITPSAEMLEEYAKRGTSDFVRAYEDTYVTTMLLDNEDTKFVLSTIEMGSFPGQKRLAERIEDTYGVPRGNIWFAATHNHQTLMAYEGGEGPSDKNDDSMNVDYIDFVHGIVMDSLKEASNKLQPIRLGYGQGESWINVSRECPSFAGTLQNANFAGPSDKTLSLLKLTDEKGNPKGIFVNYAMHNNVLFGYRMNGEFRESGGDLSGRICAFVEQGLPGDCPVGWGIAAAGDQNPVHMGFNFICEHDGAGGYKMNKFDLELATARRLIDKMASEQGQDILRIQETVTEGMEEAQIRSAEIGVDVKGRQSYRSLGLRGLKYGEAVEKKESTPVHFNCRLTTIGDIAFVGINCEAVSRLGRLIKERLPWKKVIFIEMAYGHVGYVPDSETEKFNGFSTMATMVYDTEEMERKVLGAFDELVKKLV